MQNFLTAVVVVQVVSALVIIFLVLLQHGKGADMGASFGSGASGSLFGATGSSNFLSKSTGIAASIFFVATLALAYIASNRTASVGVMDNLSGTKSLPVSASAAASSAVSASVAGQASQIPK